MQGDGFVMISLSSFRYADKRAAVAFVKAEPFPAKDNNPPNLTNISVPFKALFGVLGFGVLQHPTRRLGPFKIRLWDSGHLARTVPASALAAGQTSLRETSTAGPAIRVRLGPM